MAIFPIDPNSFVGQLLLEAFRAAGGVRGNASLTGEQAKQGLFYLNNILAQWGEHGTYVFFINTVEIPAKQDGLEYKIGLGQEVDMQPFSTITSVTYNVGTLTYTPQWITPKEFQTIVLKQITTYSSVYTYEVYRDYTTLRLYPRTMGGNQIITIKGKQRLDKVELFDDSTVLPSYALNAAIFTLAQILAVVNGYEPSSNLTTEAEKYVALMTSSNKFDAQIETFYPFTQQLPFGGRNGMYGR